MIYERNFIEFIPDIQISLKINGGRHVEGVLRGFDPFMNLVLDEGIEMTKTGER